MDMGQSQPSGPPQPQRAYKVTDLLVLCSSLAPLLLSASIVSLSFLFQNFKGFVFLGFLLAAAFLREFMLSQTLPSQDVVPAVCNAVQFSVYGNTTFSLFVFAFTLMYLCLPMFIGGSVNWFVFAGLLVYLGIDMGVKTAQQCIQWSRRGTLANLGDVLMGLGLSAMIVSAMYAGGSQQYLFFNETSSNKETCSMPKKQTFKCQVYKNGELVGNV